MCDTFAVLADSTKDGSVIFGKNSDRDPNEPHYVEIAPARDYEPGSMLDCTYVSIPQVAHTNRVLLCRPVWIWGAEMGVNEHGVVIGNEAIFSKLPAGKEPGMIGMDYLRLGLERANSAYDTLTVITTLLEKHGQSGNCGFSHPFYYHNSYLIADKKEAWKLETVGKQWAAKKIEHFGSISNGLTIHDDWDLCSKDMISFAVDQKFIGKKQPFDFATAYSDWLYTRFSDSGHRRSCSMDFLRAHSANFELKDAFQLLRSHHGDAENYRPDRGLFGSDVCMHAGFGPVRVSQSTGSLVTHFLDGRLDIWLTGSSAPCLSLFKPCNLDQNQLFDFVPGKVYEDNAYWWSHEILHRQLTRHHQDLIPAYRQERDSVEQYFMDEYSRLTLPEEKEKFWLEVQVKSEALLNDWKEKIKTASPKPTAWLYNQAWAKNDREAKI